MPTIQGIESFLEKAGDSYDVPQGVRNAAKRGLELRQKQPKSKKAGLDTRQAAAQGIGSGVARARDLVSGRVSASTIRRMNAYFSRHAKNYKLDPGKKPTEDKGYVAGLLWGGEAGKIWAARMVQKFKREKIEKGRAHAFPIGTKRKHGKVMKVKTARGWVPVEREKKGETRIGAIQIPESQVKSTAKKLLSDLKIKEVKFGRGVPIRKYDYPKDVSSADLPGEQYRVGGMGLMGTLVGVTSVSPKAKGGAKGKNPLVRLYFTDKGPQPGGRVGNWNRKAGAKGMISGKHSEAGGVKIFMSPEMLQSHPLVVESALADILTHELTHAVDKAPRGGDQGRMSREEYVNEPQEINARLSQTYADLTSDANIEWQSEQYEEYKRGEIPKKFLDSPERFLRESRAWETDREYISEKDKKRFYKLAAEVLTGIREGKITQTKKSFSFLVEKGREHAFPIGTKRKHGKVMKVKTARGWVPVKRLNRKRTRIGHIPISHKATALVSKKLLDPWYTHPKTKEMSKDLPWMRDVNIFDDPDDPRPNQFRMYNRNNWRPMHEWLRRNPTTEFPSEQQFSKKIKDVTGKTFDVEFTLRVTWDGDIPGDIKGTAQRLKDNKAVVKIVLNKKYVETTHRRDVEREVQRVTAHEIAHVMDPHAGKNYVAPERHYGAYINSPGEIRARLVEVTRDLLETGRVVAIEDQLQQKEDVSEESFRSRPQLVINPEEYLFQSPTYSRVQRYFTDETNKKFLKLAASIITAISEGKVKTGIWHSVTKATATK